MAYGGIMLTSCREPPRQFRHLRVLIVEEDGEYGSGDCNAKMADWLFEEFGQRNRSAVPPRHGSTGGSER